MATPQDIAIQLTIFVEPLLDGLKDEESLETFLRRFGFDTDSANTSALRESLFDATSPAIAALGEVVRGARSPRDAVQELYTALESIPAALTGEGAASSGVSLGIELIDFLAYRYVSTQLPPVSAALKALGVIAITRVMPADPGGRDIEFDQIQLRWNRLGDFIADNSKWAKDVYGWNAHPDADGRHFDFDLAIDRFAKLVEATEIALSRIEALSGDRAELFLRNSGGMTVEAAHVALLQFGFDGVDEIGQPRFKNEVGLMVAPSGDLANPSTLGLAVAPYAVGHIEDSVAVSETLTLESRVGGAAAGGAFLRLSPAGVEVVGGASFEATFEFDLVHANSDSAPLPLVQAPEATLIASSVFASLGGNLTGDFYAAVGVRELSATFDLTADGLLGALVPAPIVIDVGDIVMGWRPSRGVYFEGGTSLAVRIPLNIDLNVLRLYEAGIEVGWAPGAWVALTVTGDLRLGPLFAYVEDLGVRLALEDRPHGGGLLGKKDVDFGLIPPSGYAVALDGGPISGGGLLSVREHEYRGALSLKFESFGFSAFAILNTELPGAKPGFSFVASIFGEFTLPLGYGFFLTGVGGVIGLNRTIQIDALRDALYEGRLDNLLFPSDPIASAPRILQDMATVFPAKQDQYVFGPMARIAWGQPPLIEGKLGVVVELGSEVRVLILGALAAELPVKQAAVVSLRLSFFGAIDVGARTISFDATLAGSRVLTFPVSGEVAARTGWAPRTDHLVAFGGLHPAYPKPASFPSLKRLSIAFGSNNPRITLTAYAALTSNSLQFGAKADLYARGPEIPFIGRCAAEGTLGFDALVTFDPFQFHARLAGHLSLLVGSEVVANLGFEVTLSGPNRFVLTGAVWVRFLGVNIRFEVAGEWGARRTLPPQETAPGEVLRAALTASTPEPVAPSGRIAGVAFRERAAGSPAAVDPVGGLRLIQRGVPLGVRIERIGEARIKGPHRTFDIVAFEDSTELPTQKAEADFVRGHFWELSDAAKLRAPVFERHRAGMVLADGGLRIPTGSAVEAHDGDEYEVIVLGDDVEEPAPAVIDRLVPDLGVRERWARRAHAEIAKPLGPVDGRPPWEDQLTVRDHGFLSRVTAEGFTATTTGPTMGVDDLTLAVADVAVPLSVAERLTLTSDGVGPAASTKSSDDVYADYLHVAATGVPRG